MEAILEGSWSTRAGAIDDSTGVLFRFPRDLTDDEFQTVLETANDMYEELVEAEEYAAPAPSLFYLAREDQVDSPDLISVADALGACLGFAAESVTPMIPLARNGSELTVETISG